MDKAQLCAHMVKHFAGSGRRLRRDDAREFLEHHLVRRVVQLRTPQEPGLDGLGDRAQRRDDRLDLGFAQSRRDPLHRLAADRLVFQCQRHGQHQHERPTQGAVEQRCRRAGRAPQAGDDDVGVQHEPHPIRYHIWLGELSPGRAGAALRNSEEVGTERMRFCTDPREVVLPRSRCASRNRRRTTGRGSRTTGRGDRYLRSSGR